MEKNGANSHGKKKVRSQKNFQEWPGKKIRLYALNWRTLFVPPVESHWHWLTGGVCFAFSAGAELLC